jgi:CMP-N-acetylneuraminic acid synthetase
VTARRVALVPARGGSRSIPRKNIKPLGGRPLIEWVLTAIRDSGAVDATYVSTDDDEIAQVAEAAGALVPFRRPPELATDEAGAIGVVEHALAWLAEHAETPEHVLYLQPTEPFVRAADIRACYDLMVEHAADSAITVVPVPRTFHPYHVRVRDERGALRFEHEEEHYAHPTRQSDPPRFAFANLYWFRCDAFLAERRLECGTRVGLEVDPLTALDLNTPDDWKLAEALLHADDPDR